jgi:hypothetical protein
MADTGGTGRTIPNTSTKYYIKANYAYSRMFAGCEKLKTISQDLLTLNNGITTPGESYQTYVFKSMFENCVSLSEIPKLPTYLTDGCYYEMFKGCTSLTRMPALPATSLAKYCYYGMFNGCTGLTDISTNVFPAKNISVKEFSFASMFERLR